MQDTEVTEVIKGNMKVENQSSNIRIRVIEPSSRSRITVFIVDRKFSITAELKDDSKTTITEAVSTSTYSTTTG